MCFTLSLLRSLLRERRVDADEREHSAARRVLRRDEHQRFFVLVGAATPPGSDERARRRDRRLGVAAAGVGDAADADELDARRRRRLAQLEHERTMIGACRQRQRVALDRVCEFDAGRLPLCERRRVTAYCWHNVQQYCVR